jgi:hypothetical protein
MRDGLCLALFGGVLRLARWIWCKLVRSVQPPATRSYSDIVRLLLSAFATIVCQSTLSQHAVSR